MKKLLRVAKKSLVIVFFILVIYKIFSPMYFKVVSLNDNVSTKISHPNGSSEKFDSNFFTLVNRGDKVTFTVKLPMEKKEKNSVVCFFVYHAVVNAYYNGENLYSFGQDIKDSGKMIGLVDPKIPIPDDAWGKEITIVLDVCEDEAFSKINDFQLYTTSTSYLYELNNNTYGFFLSMGILFLFSVCLLLFLSGKYTVNVRKGIYLSLFAIILATWIFTNFGFYNMFAYSYFWSKAEFISIMALPIPLLLFLFEDEKDKKMKKTLGVLSIITSLFVILFIALDQLNIVHICETLFASHLITLFDGVVVLGFTIIHLIKKDFVQKRLFIGIIGVVAFGIIDIFRFNINKFFEPASGIVLPTVLPFGLVLFLVLLCESYFIAADIDRKEAIILANNLKQMELMIGTIPAGICLVRNDETAEIIEANDYFYNIFGYSKQEAMGAGFNNMLYPFDDDAKSDFSDKKMLNEKKASWEYEVTANHKDGRKIVLLVRSCYELKSNQYVISNIIDITENKKTQRRLSDSERCYRTAFDLTKKYICRYDILDHTAYFLFDAFRLFGFESRMIFNKDMPLPGNLSEDSKINFKNMFMRIELGLNGDSTIISSVGADGSKKWYECKFELVRNEKYVPISAIILFDDITEVREQEIAFNMQRRNIESMPKDKNAYFEFNLTKDVCEYHYGADSNEKINEGWEALTNYWVDNLVEYQDKKIVIEFLQKARLVECFGQGKTHDSIEYRGIKNGNTMWTRITVDMIADRFTGNIRIYCLFHNIDDEKAAILQQKNDRKKSEYYESAYNKLSSTVLYGIAKYKNDENLTIVFANEIFYQMHGFKSKKDAEEQNFDSILKLISDDKKEDTINNYKKVVEENLQRFDIEYPVYSDDGKVMWVLCCVGYSKENNMFNVSLLDITDRKNVEQNLTIKENDYKIAIQLTDRQVITYDVKAGKIYQDTYGIKILNIPQVIDNVPEGIFAKGIFDEKCIPDVRKFIDDIKSGKPSGSVYSKMKTGKSQTYRWYCAEYKLVYDIDGSPLHAIISFFDVTEKREMEIAYKRFEASLSSENENSYISYEFNLTKGVLERELGAAIPSSLGKCDPKIEIIVPYIAKTYIYKDDLEKFFDFVRAKRLLTSYAHGIEKDSIVLRGVNEDGKILWTDLSYQLLTDSYSNDLKAFFTAKNIDEAKTRELQLRQDVEELKAQLENSRIKVMMNQMQPHFLYNALSAIRTITKSDPDYAYDLLYDFSIHLRSSIKALSNDDPILFSEELKNIKAYLNIEKMRQGERLSIEYDIGCVDFYVSPLSIQPIVENAVRHGIFNRGESGGTVIIKTYENESDNIVEVIDDGVGFDKDEVLNSKRDSVGLKSLIFRLGSLLHANVDIQSEIGVGTKVVVSIPKREGDNDEGDIC